MQISQSTTPSKSKAGKSLPTGALRGVVETMTSLLEANQTNSVKEHTWDSVYGCLKNNLVHEEAVLALNSFLAGCRGWNAYYVDPASKKRYGFRSAVAYLVSTVQPLKEAWLEKLDKASFTPDDSKKNDFSKWLTKFTPYDTILKTALPDLHENSKMLPFLGYVLLLSHKR